MEASSTLRFWRLPAVLPVWGINPQKNDRSGGLLTSPYLLLFVLLTLQVPKYGSLTYVATCKLDTRFRAIRIGHTLAHL